VKVAVVVFPSSCATGATWAEVGQLRQRVRLVQVSLLRVISLVRDIHGKLAPGALIGLRHVREELRGRPGTACPSWWASSCCCDSLRGSGCISRTASTSWSRSQRSGVVWLPECASVECAVGTRVQVCVGGFARVVQAVRRRRRNLKSQH